MNAIIISNGPAPNTYTPNSFLLLLQGAEIPASVSDFERKHTTTRDSLIITSYTLPDEVTGGQNA